MHGTRLRRITRWTEADLICAVGARFDDRVTGKLARVRAAREVHPHRHRPGRDLKKCRPTSRSSATPPASAQAARVVERWKRHRVARWSPRSASGRKSIRCSTRARRQVKPAVRHRAALRADRRRRHRGHQRRPASDVGRAVLAIQQAAHVYQLGRHGHDGLRLSRGAGRADRQPRPPGRRDRRRRLGSR